MRRGRAVVEEVVAERGVKLLPTPAGKAHPMGREAKGKGRAGGLYGYADGEDSGCYSSVNIPKKRDLMHTSYVPVRVLGWRTRHL